MGTTLTRADRSGRPTSHLARHPVAGVAAESADNTRHTRHTRYLITTPVM
jgi:hypothetical protein